MKSKANITIGVVLFILLAANGMADEWYLSQDCTVEQIHESYSPAINAGSVYYFSSTEAAKDAWWDFDINHPKYNKSTAMGTEFVGGQRAYRYGLTSWGDPLPFILFYGFYDSSSVDSIDCLSPDPPTDSDGDGTPDKNDIDSKDTHQKDLGFDPKQCPAFK